MSLLDEVEVQPKKTISHIITLKQFFGLKMMVHSLQQ
jgi:hypothetical protein